MEVIDIRKENDIQIDLNGAKTKLLKQGLYDFDAARNEIRVFEGSAQVSVRTRKLTLAAKEKVALGGDGLKVLRMEAKSYEDDFYRWNGLRSGYLSEASVAAARSYLGPESGAYKSAWAGLGWYWNPWFEVYTFLPADGAFYGPFGWAFYSPSEVYRSPFTADGSYPHRFSDFHYPNGHGFTQPTAKAGRIGR